MRESTPMMAQYRALKSKHGDALLFFRLGDFYELFFEDAEVGSRELGITLTGRVAGNGERAPMCGVPYHSVDDYIKVLVDKGYRVAICDQLEDPALAKGLVKRDVTRVITPGTYWEGAESGSASYIACIVETAKSARGRGAAGLCACDLSTGEVLMASFENEPGADSGLPSSRKGAALDRAVEEVARFLPRECVIPGGRRAADLKRALERNVPGVFVTVVEEDDVKPGAAEAVYGPVQADNLGDGANAPALAGLDLMVSYLGSTQMMDLRHLRRPVFYLEEGFMEVDRPTRRNLELLERLQGGRQGTLCWVLDHSCTPLGSRLIKQWIERPLKDAVKIRERLDAVDWVFRDAQVRAALRQDLSRIKDLERLVTKVAYKSCNARDLVAVASSLEAVAPLTALLNPGEETAGVPPLLRDIAMRLDPVPDAVKAIRDALVPDPPLSVTDGYLVREGFDRGIDDLRDLSAGGKKWLAEFEARERERTGIRSLKVGYNRVFGYYIEVSRSYASSVPPEYVRRQTLSTGERYIAPELREKETAILGAEEKLCREEYRVFCEVRDYLESRIRRIQATARAVAELDSLSSLAQVAVENAYVRPEVAAEGDIVIKDGRHPVLEKVLTQGTFVPNDLRLDESQRILVITGPNMGGKSTYCRQAALIVLMAQAGSFVPASSCRIACVDKLFARVGAYDDLVLGQSTFMVEMSEVSRILRGVTPNSLVILDEIGRGTSTFDGLAVAWAVLEHLCGGPRALVATHYRELTLLADLKPSVVNVNVAVKKKGDEVVFLRKVQRGVAEGSFGIEVSAMAGLPQSVVTRAREVLLGLEAEARKGSRWKTGILGQVASRGAGALDSVIPGQAALFGGGQEEAAPDVPAESLAVIDSLKGLEIDRMTPLQALETLYELKKRLEDRQG